MTVGGFSASTSLPVGGPTAPATVWKSVQCQALFIAACRDGLSIHPLRPQVKTGSEPPLRFGHAPSLTVPLDAVEAGSLPSDEVGNQRLHVVLTIISTMNPSNFLSGFSLDVTSSAYTSGYNGCGPPTE